MGRRDDSFGGNSHGCQSGVGVLAETGNYAVKNMSSGSINAPQIIGNTTKSYYQNKSQCNSSLLQNSNTNTSVHVNLLNHRAEQKKQYLNATTSAIVQAQDLCQQLHQDDKEGTGNVSTNTQEGPINKGQKLITNQKLAISSHHGARYSQGGIHH